MNMNKVNKEKLEQMKKEKLEQMKELGRGGFSRGLSLLHKATASANVNANTTTDGGDADASSSSSAASSGGGAESATLLPSGAKPSYDDLVALSMKLTRQNKLMKAQFQKMQARITTLQVSDVDCRVLSAFLSDVVGVDVVACQRDAASASSTTEDGDDTAASTLDVAQLRERFEIVDALKTKALKQQIAQLQMQMAAKETNMSLSLLPMSPMAPPPAAVSAPLTVVPQYEEIDLLGDMFAGSSQPQQQQPPPPPQQPSTSAFSDDLLSFDFPPAAAAAAPAAVVKTSAVDREAYTLLEKQLNDATGTLRRLEDEMKRSATENQELRKQLNDVAQQHTQQVNQLTSEKHETVQRLEESATNAQAQLEAAQERVAALQQQIDQLRTEQTQREEISTPLVADDSEVSALETEMKTVQTHNEHLRVQVTTLQAAADNAAVSVRELEAAISTLRLENQTLAAKAAKEPSVDSEQPVVNGRAPDTEVNQLRDRVKELAAVNENLQHQESRAAPADTGGASDISALLEELERVKMARAEADHTTKALQETLTVSEKKLTKSLNDAEQNATVIQALRAEIGHHSTELKRVEGELTESQKAIETLQQEKRQLEEAKEVLEEQLQVLRLDNNSNLESVVGELASAKKQVAEQREYMNSKIELLIRDLDAARKQCEGLEATQAEKEKQHQKMVSSQSTLTNEVMGLQKQVRAMEQDLQMAAEGLEAHASKAEENALRRKESEEKLKNARLQIETLKDQHLTDLEMMRSEKETELDRVRAERNQTQKKLSESEAAYAAVSQKWSAAQEDLDHEKKRSNDLEARLGQLTAEIGNMSIDLAETKKALSDRMALATRLQTENMGFAEKQAEQAARVESALRDVSSSKQLVADIEAKMQDAKADAHRCMAERDAAVEERTTLMRVMDEERERMSKELEAQLVKFNAAVAAEKDALRRELDRVEGDSKQKSKLALHAVLEKEAEIERLSKRLADLEEDVRSGDADNRKIFEFAQMQANRELEARANGAKIHELTRELEAAHAHIQALERDHARHGEELTAMMQTQRREGVNMEYLKNVIVQFMSFKAGSSQQMRLVPVISTLLQFTSADLKEIKQAGRRSSWGTWGAETHDYKPIAAVPAPSPAGGDGAAPTRRRTSPPTAFSSSSTGYESSRSMPPRASSFTLPPHDEDAVSSSSSDMSGTQSADF